MVGFINISSLRSVSSILILISITLLASCGDDSSAPQLNPRDLTEEETAGGPGSDESNPESENPESTDNYSLSNVSWEFGCDSLTPLVKPADETSGSDKLIGLGEQRLTLDGTTRLNLQLSGTACMPTSRLRHILFAVSVARSMDDVDPKSNRTCSRLTAVTSAVTRLEASAQKDSIRVGYLTFDDRVRSQSPQLVTLAQFRNSYLDDDIFCDENNRPTTSYDIGLSTASERFTASAVGTTDTQKISREIYLITNQAPRNSVDGFGVARNLISKMDVSINSIMVGQNSTQVADGISSRDHDNKPLHSNIEAMGALSGMLSQVAEKVIVDASIEVANLSAKPVAWTRLPLVDDLYKGYVGADATDITKRTFKVGLGVRISVWDSHGKSETQESTLLFE